MVKSRRVLRESAETLREGFGFDNQRDKCIEFEKKHNLLVVKEHPLVESSSTWRRDKFETIINEAIAEQNEIPYIVFPRVDRFARNLEAAGYYLGMLRRNGLKLGFAEEDLVVDSEVSTMSLLMVFVHSFKADQDGKQIKSNMLGGRDKLGTEGHQLPNGMATWPFDYTPKRIYGKMTSGRPTLNSNRASWVRKWAQWMLNDGVSQLEVCRRMEEAGIPAPRGGRKWSSATINRILRSKSLIGEFYWKGELIYTEEGETVLTREQFDALQRHMDVVSANSYYNAAKLDYPPLRGMVFCHCGRRMGACPNHGVGYYRCLVCRKPLINAQQLWGEIKREIEGGLLREDRIIPALTAQVDKGNLIAQKEQQLKELGERVRFFNNKWDALYRLASPDYPMDRFKKREQEITDALDKANKEKAQVEQELSTLRQRKLDEEGIVRFCRLVATNLKNLTKPQWQMMLEMLKLKITIYDKDMITINVALPAVREETKNEFSRL